MSVSATLFLVLTFVVRTLFTLSELREMQIYIYIYPLLPWKFDVVSVTSKKQKTAQSQA